MSYDFFGLNEMVKKLEESVEKLEAVMKEVISFIEMDGMVDTGLLRQLEPSCKDCKEYGCTPGYCDNKEFFKQLDGGGEPHTDKWEERRKNIANEWTEYEKKEEQEAPRKGEAEPKDDALFWKHEYLTAIEVEIPKLIAEFLEDLDNPHSREGLVDKWESRRDKLRETEDSR